MSQENVEIVRLVYTPLEEGGYQASDTGDFNEGIERFIAGVAAPDIEWISLISTATEGHGYRGHEGLREWARDMQDAWEYFRTNAEELTDAGDQVVVSVHVNGRGRVSGAVVDLHAAHVWTLRDGRAVRMQAYGDTVDAREAAGLSE